MANGTGLLHLFKEQLENEFSSIAVEHELVQRGHLLIWWYFARLMGFSPAKIEEVICDGGGDLGIDAIYIDDNMVVHFYQFKNPLNSEDGFAGGDVDKVLAGLNLILSRKHDTVANESLKDRIELIYQEVPNGYRLHLVTSGKGISVESERKLDAFIDSFGGPSRSVVTWSEETLEALHDLFYKRSLPTVDEPIRIPFEQMPYPVSSGGHESYLLHATGEFLGELFNEHGELLLQQNIRVSQGDTSTNNSIRSSCTGDHASKFFHYNNGITFLCDTAVADPFKKQLTLTRAQVVNGGQTIRVLAATRKSDQLKPDVLVPIRVITSMGDKDFASNVAVNLNNQNRIESSVLRSNNPRIIQLSNAMASDGWYLERREGEVLGFSPEERTKNERRIGGSLEGRVISLREGAQAYVATFLQMPEVAKKNPKRIFLDAHDGGLFEKVFDDRLTAAKFVMAHQMMSSVDTFVGLFMACKRRKSRVADWQAEYREVLTAELVDDHGQVIDQIIPQCSMFVAAMLYRQHVLIGGMQHASFRDSLASDASTFVCAAVRDICRYVHRYPEVVNKSWPTLLKSQSFYDKLSAFVTGRLDAELFLNHTRN